MCFQNPYFGAEEGNKFLQAQVNSFRAKKIQEEF